MNRFRFSDLSLRRKILGGYAVVTILLLLVCVWAIANLYRLGQASEAILQENYRSILAAENMVAALERQDSNVLSLLWGHSGNAQAEFQANAAEFLIWLGRAQDNVTIAEEPAELAAIQSSYSAYLTAVSQLNSLQEQTPEAVPDFYLETVFPLFQQVRDSCNRLRDINQEQMVVASDNARRVSAGAIWSTLLIGAATAVFGLTFGLILSGHLTRPLKEMAAATDKIAAGDYDVRLDSQSGDEVGHLAGKIMAMSQTLQEFHALNVGQLLAEKQKNEAIIQAIDDGIVLLDGQCHVMTLNPKAMTIFGVSREQALGRHLFDLTRYQPLHDAVKQTWENGRFSPLNEEQATLSIQQGEQTTHYRFSLSPVQLEPGHRGGVVLLLQDVTRLKELDRLKSEFVMTASHELRTPLTGLSMSVGLLVEQAFPRLSPKEQELLLAAQEEIGRLRALVDDLLNLSKIESGRIAMQREPVPVRFLIEQAVSLLQQQAEEKGIHLTGEVGEETAVVLADPNKILWVLTNLIANALRYTPPDGHITLTTHNAGSLTYISVSDDGEGIPLEYQASIFDKFVQVQGRSSGGTGLGLAISKEIVKAHQGTIWVKSEPGAGSTFTFVLPNVVEN
jgi:two-component system, NtrC family, sensor histidine kinase KinB